MASLQKAVRLQDAKSYEEYARAINDQDDLPFTLRGCWELASGRDARAPRRGRAGDEDRAPLRHRRHVLRQHQQGGAREPRHRDEPHRRASPTAARAARTTRDSYPTAERRLEAKRDQAGRERALRRDRALPGQRRRAADQDGAGRQARRGRAAARAQGRRSHRARSPLDAGRDAHLAAAAPRHLFDRGSGAAHLRPQERQPTRARQREARQRGRRRHHRRGRGQGARGRDPHRRARRRHGRLAAVVHPARRHAVGARAGRGAAGARR